MPCTYTYSPEQSAGLLRGPICGGDPLGFEHNILAHDEDCKRSMWGPCLYHEYEEAMNPTAASALIQLRQVADDIEVLGQPGAARRLRDESVVIEAAFVPDIELPEFEDVGPGRVPVSCSATLDGKVIQFVNWIDFRGWEVRAHDSFSRMDEEPKVLGYISGTEDSSGRQWRAKRLPAILYSSRKPFARVDEAVRWLMSL